MSFLRSCLHMLWMLLTVIPWGIIMVVCSLWIRGKPLWWMAVRWLGWAIGGARVILGIQTRVIGYDNLPVGQTSPAILLVKHQSTFETFLMPTLMPHPLAYVFKKELLYVPFFGWAMGRLDMIHIDRNLRAKAFNKVVAQGKVLLAQGIWIIMFPEGTRIPRGHQGTYRTGGTRLAIETGAPVIPIAVTSAKCWPRKAFLKTPGVVEVSIGKPIPSAGRTPEDLMREVEQWIEAEMRRLDPEAYLPATNALPKMALNAAPDTAHNGAQISAHSAAHSAAQKTPLNRPQTVAPPPEQGADKVPAPLDATLSP